MKAVRGSSAIESDYKGKHKLLGGGGVQNRNDKKRVAFVERDQLPKTFWFNMLLHDFFTHYTLRNHTIWQFERITACLRNTL